MFCMWNGVEARVAMTDDEKAHLSSLGFVQVPGFELDRLQPSVEQVKEMLAEAHDDGEYQTKDMVPKRRGRPPKTEE